MRQAWNIIKYLMVYIINLLMLAFLHGYFNLMIAVLLLVMPLVSISVAAYALRRMSVHFSGARENMHIDSPFFIQVVLDNPTLIPLINVNLKLSVENQFFKLNGVHTLNIPAYARQDNAIIYPLQSDYLGILTIEVKELQVTDWLGFVTLHKKMQGKKEIVLLPSDCLTIEPELSALQNGMTEVEESKNKGTDFSEVQDVREYRPGDKLQNIHWKLSAKKDEWMVKERVSLSSSQLIVFVELFQDESMILNRILTAAYGMGLFLIEQRIPFSFHWWSVKDGDMKTMYIDTVPELEHWMEIVYYENFYDDAGMGYMMLKRLLQEDTKFLVIGCAASLDGDVLLQYGSDVKGCICR